MKGSRKDMLLTTTPRWLLGMLGVILSEDEGGGTLDRLQWRTVVGTIGVVQDACSALDCTTEPMTVPVRAGALHSGSGGTSLTLSAGDMVDMLASWASEAPEPGRTALSAAVAALKACLAGLGVLGWRRRITAADFLDADGRNDGR